MGRTRGMADANALNQAFSKSFGWNSFDEMMAAIDTKGPSKQKGKKKKSD
jgi:hypothetical protein